VATKGRSRRGNAETLRRYWSIGGVGGARIGWGTPGAWTRCNRQLSKYMGARAKGYCQLMKIRNGGAGRGRRRG